MGFLAHMIQKPWEKPEFAVVMIGDKGIGKSFMLGIIETLVDGRETFQRRSRHFYRTSNPEDIYGRFRDHLQSKIALGLEEVTWGGDRRHEGTLKDYITGHTIKAEKKNGPILDLSNVMRIFMTANPGWIVPTSADERRYMIFNVANERQQQHEYFARVQDSLDDGGYEAFMYELEHWDINDFNCRVALHTNELIDQTKKNFNKGEEWWDEILEGGEILHLDGKNKVMDYGLGIYVSTDILYDSYVKYIKKHYPRANIPNNSIFGIMIHEFLPVVVDGRVARSVDGRRVASILVKERFSNKSDGVNKMLFYILPSLDVCRKLWDFRLKRNYEWGTQDDWSQPTVVVF